MIKIRERNLALLMVTVMLVTAVAMAGGFLLFCKMQKVSLIREDRYKEMLEMNRRYAKLYAMQNRINTEGLKKVSRQREMNGVYKGLVDSLGDKYSQYFTAKEAKDFENYINNAFYGIGVIFRQEENGDMVITQVQKDAPAEAAGLRKGDIIVAVNGKHCATAKAVRKAVEGKAGTKVKITYRRNGTEKTVAVTRGIVKDSTCSGLMLKGNVAYIRVEIFGEDTAKEFQETLSELKKQKPKGLIMDLRNNVGGQMDQSLEVADQLLPECTIAYSEDRAGKRTNYNSKEGALGLPMVLLINEHTASASELLAAAVKDNGAGKLVGVTTYGKGVIQTEYKYSDGSAMKLTTAQFFSPKGRSINGKGVKPDYKVKLTKEDQQDRQLEKALSLVD